MPVGFVPESRAIQTNCCNQMIALKFRLLSIHFTSEEFETGRKMSAMGIFRQL